MGIFDGILICSDWDGTLHTPSGMLESDIKSIRYFQDNGGLFTVCSGRPYAYLREYWNDFAPNTYVPTLNGAVIVEPNSGRTIYRGYLDERAPEIIEAIISLDIPLAFISVHYEDCGVPVCVDVKNMNDFRAKARGRKLYKIVFVAPDVETITELKAAIKGIDLSGYMAVSSWSTSLEILSEDSAKGAAIRRIRELTGAKTVIAVGDYENDIDMLRAADISYAVANAHDSVKAVATRCTVSVQDGAISHIIADIKKMATSASK